MTETENRAYNFDVMLISIVAISSLILIGTAWVSGGNNTQMLVLLVIFGVIDLVAVLTLAGRVYLKTGLECKDEALGLPNGSVRALIALSLIIIFAIMTVFMYTNLSPAQNVWHADENQTVILANGTLITPGPNGGMDVILTPSEAQQNFAQQTLTTVSTLVVALAGFYFGTKAVSVAKEGKEEAKKSENELTVKSKNGQQLPTGEYVYKEKLQFEIETEPKGQKLSINIDGADKESLKTTPDSSVYVLEPVNRKKSVVTIIFALDVDKQIEKKVQIVFEKLEVSPKEGTVKQGESIVFATKSIPEDKNVKSSVIGDDDKSLKRAGNGYFVYTPSEKGKIRPSDTVFFTFELEGSAPKIIQDAKIEVKT